MGFRRFHLRGIKKAATEWTLITLAYNCRRIEVAGLIATAFRLR
jgi:hypothetical protein